MRKGLGWLILTILLGWAIQTEAHGGGTPQVTNALSGPYVISVWTQPEPLQVGREMHMTVALSRPLTAQPDLTAEEVAGLPVLNAKIKATFRQANQSIQAEVTHENAANQLFYEADFILPREGQWQVALDIAGLYGPTQLTFELLTTAETSSRWQWLVAGVGILGVVGGWWWWRAGGGGERIQSVQRERRQRQEISQ